MTILFKKKTKEEVLKDQYSELMRKSYKKALKDKAQSDLVKEKAQEIFNEILQLQSA